MSGNNDHGDGFIVIGLLFVICIGSLLLNEAGMEITTGSRIYEQTDTETYCYTIKEIDTNFNFGEHEYKKKYVLEFRGGSEAQRLKLKTTPFHRKMSTYIIQEARAAAQNTIVTWQETLSGQ